MCVCAGAYACIYMYPRASSENPMVLQTQEPWYICILNWRTINLSEPKAVLVTASIQRTPSSSRKVLPHLTWGFVVTTLQPSYTNLCASTLHWCAGHEETHVSSRCEELWFPKQIDRRSGTSETGSSPAHFNLWNPLLYYYYFGSIHVT